MLNIKQIEFKNSNVPKSHFDLIRLEELFSRRLDHDITLMHKVNFYLIFFITDNNGEHRIDFTDYKYKKGEVLTVRKDQLHKFTRTKAKGFMLIFTEEFISSFLEELEALKTLQLFNELLGHPKVSLNEQEFKDLSALVNHISFEYFKIADEYSPGIIRSALHILITKLYRIKSDNPVTIGNRKYLQQFIEFQNLVEQKCFETKTVKDYAAELGCSTKTLNNVSHSIVNKSAKAFIDDIVIKQIKRHLLNSTFSIKEIAYEAGFDETTNFYKYFKKFTNTTPELFRQTN
jgi:AraC family transcriptional regulator, transcriptional activator of pobA